MYVGGTRVATALDASRWRMLGVGGIPVRSREFAKIEKAGAASPYGIGKER